MASIGGPGGIGGPKGPDGPDEVGGLDDVAGPDDIAATHGASGLDASLSALAAEISAGRMTPREAIDQMVEDAGADLGQAERTELRELLTDLVSNDPYLAGLVGRVQ